MFPRLFHIQITHYSRGHDETPQAVISGLGVEFAAESRAADDDPADGPWN